MENSKNFIKLKWVLNNIKVKKDLYIKNQMKIQLKKYKAYFKILTLEYFGGL